MFITLEGIDGSGKTTAAKYIEENFDVALTQEPSDFWTGKQVRRALQEETPDFTDFFLFMADRVYHIEEFIKPKIENDEVVVSDRFSDSTLAYQGARLDVEDGWMQEVMKPWNIEPNLTIYFDVPISVALERADKVEKYENKEMLKQVAGRYGRIRRLHSYRYTTIDASVSKEEMLEQVHKIISEAIEAYN